MKLVYTDEFFVPDNLKGQEVQLGDKARTFRGEEVTVLYFRPPHKSGSSGKITVDNGYGESEYYVGVIGAKWIESRCNNEEVIQKIKELVELVKAENPNITYLTVSWMNENGEDYFSGYADDKDKNIWRLT